MCAHMRLVENVSLTPITIKFHSCLLSMSSRVGARAQCESSVIVMILMTLGSGEKLPRHKREARRREYYNSTISFIALDN